MSHDYLFLTAVTLLLCECSQSLLLFRFFSNNRCAWSHRACQLTVCNCCRVETITQIVLIVTETRRMNYGKKSPSMGTPSVYSHVTTRSSANLRSSRSAKSVKIPWYQKPILSNAFVIDIQRGALLTAVFSLVRRSYCNMYS